MFEFFAALAAFLAAHTLPRATGARDRLIARFGRGRYMAAYSAVSVLSLVWLISAAARAPYVEIWAPSPALAAVPMAAMPVAFMLFAAGATRANPASVSFRGGPADAAAPGILALTRHPILWAFFGWSASHLAANGDVVGVTLFGGFAAFSLAGMRMMEARAAARGEVEALSLARGGLGERLRRAWSPRLAAELAAGLALWAAALALHDPVIGVDPLAWF